MYVKIVDGVAVEYTLNQLMLEHPRTSFPRVMTDAGYAEWGMYPLTIADVPKYDPRTQEVKHGEIYNENGAWVRGWIVTEKDVSDVAARVRKDRAAALASSDWTQIPDSPLTPEQRDAWAIYRQSLRDLTSQEGFPHNVTWPSEP